VEEKVFLLAGGQHRLDAKEKVFEEGGGLLGPAHQYRFTVEEGFNLAQPMQEERTSRGHNVYNAIAET